MDYIKLLEENDIDYYIDGQTMVIVTVPLNRIQIEFSFETVDGWTDQDYAKHIFFLLEEEGYYMQDIGMSAYEIEE